MATATTTYSSHSHSHSSPRRSHMPASPTSPSAATTMAYRIKLAEMEVLLQQAQRDLAAAKAEVNAQDAVAVKRRSLTSSSNSNANTARRSSLILDDEVDYENKRHNQDDLEKRPATSYKSYNERARLDGVKERDISTTGLKSAKKLPHPPPRPQTAPSTSNDAVPTFGSSIASTFSEKSVLKGSARSRRHHRSHKNRLAKFSPNNETVPEESELSTEPYYASDNDSVDDDPDADRYSLSSLSALSEADHSVKPSKSRPQSRGNTVTTTKPQSEAYVPPVPPLPTPLVNTFSDQDIYNQRTQSSLSGHGAVPPSRQSTFTSTTSFSPSSASVAAPPRNPREAHAYASAANYVRQRTMDVSLQHDPYDATPPPIGRLKDNAHLRLTRSEDAQPTFVQTRTGWVTKKPTHSRDSASSGSSTLSKLRNPFAALGKLTGGRSSRNGSIASTTASLRSPSMSSSILNVTQSQSQQRRPSTTMSFHPTSPNPSDKQQLPALKKLTLDPRALREDAALRAQALNAGKGSGAPSPALGGTMSPPLKSPMSMSSLSVARPSSAAATVHSGRANVQTERAMSPVMLQAERTPTPTRLQPQTIPAPVAAPVIPKSGRPSLELSGTQSQAPAPPAKARPSLDLGNTISSIVKTTRRLSSGGLPSAEKASRPSIDSLKISPPILQHKTSNISAVSALTGGGPSPISGARPALPTIGTLSPELPGPPFMLQPNSSFSSLGRAKTPAPILIGKTSFDTSVRPGTGMISPLASHPVHLPPKSPPLPHIDTGIEFMGLDGATDSANPSLSGPSGPPVRRGSEGQVSLPRPIIVRSPGSTSSIVKSPVSPLTPVNGLGMGLPSPAASYFGEPPLSGRPQHRRARSKSDTMLIDERNGPKSPLGNITTISAAPKEPSNKLFSALKFGSSTDKEKDRTAERDVYEKEKEKEKEARPSTRGSLYSLGAALKNSSTDLLKSFKDRDDAVETENAVSMTGPSPAPPPIPLQNAVHNRAESQAGLARQGTQASLYSLAQSTSGSTSKHKRGKSEKSPGILSSIFRPKSRSSMSGPSSISIPSSAPPALPDIKGLPYTSFSDPRPATSGPLSAPLVSTTFSIDRLPPPPIPAINKDSNTAFAGATPPPITLSKFQDTSAKKHTLAKSTKLKDSPKKSKDKDKQITIVSVPYETSSPLKSPVHTSDRDKLLPTRNGVSRAGTETLPIHTNAMAGPRPLDVGGEDLELGLGLGLMGMSMQDIDLAPADVTPSANGSPTDGYGRAMSLSLSVARSPSLGTVLE